MMSSSVPWTCVARQVIPGHWKTTFTVGVQHFTLAESDDPEEGQHHCEFIRDQFLTALQKAGFIP